MRKLLTAALLAAVVTLPLAGAGEGGKFTIKTADSAAPDEVAGPIAQLLDKQSVQLLDEAGKPIVEVWARKQVPTDATPEQIKNGVTYRELKQTEVLGVARFHRDWTDYRKQPVKAGVYTLRLAYQPTDGKHTADVSEFPEFVVVIGAKADKSADLMEPKLLQETSADSIASAHPGVFMLVPAKAGAAPELKGRPRNEWAVVISTELVAAGKGTGARLGIGFNLVGHSPA